MGAILIILKYKRKCKHFLREIFEADLIYIKTDCYWRIGREYEKLSGGFSK